MIKTIITHLVLVKNCIIILQLKKNPLKKILELKKNYNLQLKRNATSSEKLKFLALIQ